MPVVFKIRSFITFIFSGLVALTVLNLLVVVLFHQDLLQSDFGLLLYRLFNVDRELNLSSFFNTVLLLIVAASLYITYYLQVQHRKTVMKYYWLILALLFVGLALDENISVHERLMPILPARGIGGDGFFTFAWVIPYAVATLLFVLFYIRFLLALPKSVRQGFVLSGVVFVSGAIGFEMIGAKIATTNGMDSLLYALLASSEELLEMAGLVLFLYYNLSYIRMSFKPAFLVMK